jgi:succinate dehydrogenase / fumarate reductase flavoprotein subunit
MYSQEMTDSVERLVTTRPKRMGEELPALSLTEKEVLLRGSHPDYRSGTLRELQVGPNKGERILHEIADLFESGSRVSPGGFDLSEPDHETDVLIIGGGGAGVSAALTAHESGAGVLLATKLRLGDANTMMAQGGIQAADKPNDSPPIHFLDIIGGGGFTNIPPLVRALVTDGPAAIAWLERLGVMFDKADDGTMMSIHGGGTSRMRMHSARDYTGGEIMKTLRDEIKNRGIDVIEFSPAIELLTGDDGAVTGAILLNLETEEHVVVRAKTTILATGGCGRLHILGFPTSNHYGATADGLVMGYRAGCPVIFMDTIQYHPTGAAYPEQIVGLLITEKCRALGAQLVNDEGNRFIYELETRDAEAAAIIRECDERKKCVTTPGGMTGVWLDTPMIDIIHGEGTIQAMLPAMYRQFMRFDVDMSREPLLVYPTQHYQNGGLVIDENGRTEVANLYTAGEVEGGVHGRNRLMGNSLLEVVVYGRRAGKAAALQAKDGGYGNLTLKHIEQHNEELRKAGIEVERQSPMLLPDYRRKGGLARMIDV